MARTRAALLATAVRVIVGNDGFSPRTVMVALGGGVEWEFRGSRSHRVVDVTGLALFDSGRRRPGSTFGFAFSTAGSYPYRCPLHPATARGRVDVSMQAAPAGGDTRTVFDLAWSTAEAPADHVFDVQFRPPGAAAFEDLRRGLTTDRGSFVPNVGAGTYAFRARLRRVATGETSGWSPEIVITVAPPTGGTAASPYPPSPIIGGVTFDFARLVRAAQGSDLWPVTWGPDDQLYTSWGDGGGFGGGDGDGRVSLGFARISGPPESFTAANVWGGKDPESPATFGGKASGLLAADGVLYAWINLQNAGIPDKKLAWSADLGRTWQLEPWSFPGEAGGFNPLSFLNYRADYSGARDGYVYVYGKRWSDALDPWFVTDVYLARVPREGLRVRELYEFYAGIDEAAVPRWTPVLADTVPVMGDTLPASVEAVPVLSDPSGLGTPSVIHDAALGRYLALASHGGEVENLAIFDGPEPWGPWTTAAYEDEWGGLGSGEALLYSIPTKWLSADGRSFWIVFSSTGALDAFNLVPGRLEPP